MFASPSLPTARGPLSGALIDYLDGRARTLPDPVIDAGHNVDIVGDDVHDEDFQLALYCAYELHYRGFDVDTDREWDPAVLTFRRRLEDRFEAALRHDVARPAPSHASPTQQIADIIDSGEGPALSQFMERDGELWQFREFAIHRSLYQLKEADAHTWAIPRYSGSSRSALIEIQMDEYGNGVPGQSHAELFAQTMAALGLDPSYGAYVDAVGALTMATSNLVTLFGLHRRLLPSLLGHLAVFENTSVTPMGRYAAVCSRFGLDDEARRFYDVHVVADEHHGPLASRRLVGDFVTENPAARGEVMWGAACVMELEERLATELYGRWVDGRSALRVGWGELVHPDGELSTQVGSPLRPVG